MKAIGPVLALALAGACHRNPPAEGPLERAGKNLDHAAQKTGKALGGAAQKTGKALQGAARKTGEAAEDAAHATGKAFEKGGAKLQGKPDPGPEKPATTPQKTSD